MHWILGKSIMIKRQAKCYDANHASNTFTAGASILVGEYSRDEFDEFIKEVFHL